MIAVSGTLIESNVTQPGVVVPPIEPTSAPAYVPPTQPVIPPNPMVAAAPDYQFRGEGGTPFGSNPPAYLLPYTIEPPVRDYGLSDTGAVPVERVSKLAVPRPFILPPRPGEDQVMPVPTGQQPAKPNVAPAVEPVSKPGPVSGTFQGFDLARIPFWAWLVGAAVLGSRLLR